MAATALELVLQFRIGVLLAQIHQPGVVGSPLRPCRTQRVRSPVRRTPLTSPLAVDAKTSLAVIAHNRFPIRQPFAGGLESHVWYLVRALAARGHDVSLFAAPGSDLDIKVEPFDVDNPKNRREVSPPVEGPDPGPPGLPNVDGVADRRCRRVLRSGSQSRVSLLADPVGFTSQGADVDHAAYVAGVVARVRHSVQRRTGQQVRVGESVRSPAVAWRHRGRVGGRQRCSRGGLAARFRGALPRMVWPHHTGEGSARGHRSRPPWRHAVGVGGANPSPAIFSAMRSVRIWAEMSHMSDISLSHNLRNSSVGQPRLS